MGRKRKELYPRTTFPPVLDSYASLSKHNSHILYISIPGFLNSTLAQYFMYLNRFLPVPSTRDTCARKSSQRPSETASSVRKPEYKGHHLIFKTHTQIVGLQGEFQGESRSLHPLQHREARRPMLASGTPGRLFLAILHSRNPAQRARGTEQAEASAFRDTSSELVYLQLPQSSATPPRSGPLAISPLPKPQS